MNKEERAAYNKKWCEEHKEHRQQYFKDYETKHAGRLFANRYKIEITHEQYQSMVDQQHGKCAICGQSPSRRLDIDHNHITKEIRGLLCSRCNTVLGRVNESTEVLHSMIEYLESYR